MSLPDPVADRHRRVDPVPSRRAANSSPRRRTNDPTPRRREDDHKKGGIAGAFMVVGIALGFLAYIFNFSGFATSADSFFSGLDSSAHAQNDAVVSLTEKVVPIAALFIGALILYAMMRLVMRGARKSKKTRTLANRDVISLEHFQEITHARGIRPRISLQAYALLLPHYRSTMRARMDDRLREDLYLTEAQVGDLIGNLLRNTDRRSNMGDQPQIRTVMDLLQFAQKAKRQSLMNSGSRAYQAVRKMSFVRPAAKQAALEAKRRESDLARAGK